jgi:hypothetical protein
MLGKKPKRRSMLCTGSHLQPQQPPNPPVPLCDIESLGDRRVSPI